LESSCDREAWVRFTVADTGIGIAPEDQERIFAPFTQIDAAMSRRHEGAGLGLAISAELIQAMAGVRSVRSTPGFGSEFSFLIPLPIDQRKADLPPQELAGEQAAATHPLRQAYGGPKLNVLLAEDVRTNQLIVVQALGKRGHKVHVVNDGAAAVELAAHSRFDAILMDVQMPHMDGIEATKAIRQSQSPSRRTPIIALTAHSMVGDRERCLASGMDGYLSKPLDLRELIEVVEGVVTRDGDRDQHGSRA
jgi:CheY-like chemotaxis protein